MTAPEYIQLRAFARIDGVRLSILWIASFACYIWGLRSPAYGLVAMLLAFATPFLSFRMLRRFRDQVLDGLVSFWRGWAYVVFHFFYAALLFAVAQFVYFAYLDNGYFINGLQQMLEAPENTEAIRAMGITDSMSQTIEAMRKMRPIDLALQILTSNLMLGCIMALPIAAYAKRSPLKKVE